MQGKILMTHPTKAIYGSLLRDFVKLAGSRQAEEQIFNEEDLRNSMPRIDVIDFHQTVDINGIKVQNPRIHQIYPSKPPSSRLFIPPGMVITCKKQIG